MIKWIGRLKSNARKWVKYCPSLIRSTTKDQQTGYISCLHLALFWFLLHISVCSQFGSLLQCWLLFLNGCSSSQTHSHSHVTWIPSRTETQAPTCSARLLLIPRPLQSKSFCNSCSRRKDHTLGFPRQTVCRTHYEKTIEQKKMPNRVGGTYMSSTYFEAIIIVVMSNLCTFETLIRKPGLFWQNRSIYT